MKLKSGDSVQILLGKDRGKKGKIEKIFPKNEMVLVNGINMFKRHRKQKSEKDLGGIIEITKPLAVSKVALICPKCNKLTRIKYLLSKNEKIRICAKCNAKL